MEQTTFKAWCLVELFGHQKIAGEVSDFTLGGSSFVRVDVPATTKKAGFTKMYGASAIYAISPVDEQYCRMVAERLDVEPVAVWMPEIMKRNTELEKRLELAEGKPVDKPSEVVTTSDYQDTDPDDDDFWAEDDDVDN